MQLRVQNFNVNSIISIAVFESNHVTELEELVTRTESAIGKNHKSVA